MSEDHLYCQGHGSVMGSGFRGIPWGHLYHVFSKPFLQAPHSQVSPSDSDPGDIIDCVLLWLPSWGIDRPWKLYLSNLCVFLLALFIQYLSLYLHRPSLNQESVATFWKKLFRTPRSMGNAVHFFDSVCHGIRLGAAYLIMLAIMTYSSWYFACAILGFVLGYYLFHGEDAEDVDFVDPCCSN